MRVSRLAAGPGIGPGGLVTRIFGFHRRRNPGDEGPERSENRFRADRFLTSAILLGSVLLMLLVLLFSLWQALLQS